MFRQLQALAGGKNARIDKPLKVPRPRYEKPRMSTRDEMVRFFGPARR